MVYHYKKYVLLILLFYLVLITGVLSGQNISGEEIEKVYYNISVVGIVGNPGVYSVSPSSRISKVISIAGILEEGSLRNIILKRNNENIILDLQRFYTYGDEENNPYIMDGDIIFVPALQKKVSIYGAINRSGTYELREGDRISDIIELAMGFRDDVYLDKAEVVRFKNNYMETEIISIDLRKVIENTECNDNLLLKNDDRIFIKTIPEYHKREELKVTIYGAVKNPEQYNFTEGYRLSDAIAASGGLRDDTYLERAEIVRFKDDHIDTEIITVNLKNVIENPECEDNLLLKNDDRIFIRSLPEFHEKKSITILGEVKFPGVYTIEESKVYLSEILEKCGGITNKADMQNAYLQRKSKEDVIDSEFERLKKMLVEDMSDMEYEYFKTKSRELKGRLSTDFVRLWFDKDKDADVLLKNGDFIYIPDKTITVTVSGQVKNPGLVTYIPGKNYLYYIDKAGGYAWRARKGKIRLIKAITGEWLKPKANTTVAVGDMIFIPEKPEIEFWELFKDIMVVSAQIATVLIVIQNATSK